MSVITPKRLFLCIVAVLAGTGAYASHPSPRTLARMAYDSQNRVAVLFGGRGKIDVGGTSVAQGSDETWLFSGSNWAQRFPANTPPGRSTHAMTYDSRAGRVLMFGGRQEATSVTRTAKATFFNDLWAYQNDNWTRIDGNSAERPAEREFPGMVYDPDRDVVVMYGGFIFGGKENREELPIYDTWEFAGGSWTRTALDDAKVSKPLLAYDRAAKQVVMLGVDSTASNTPVMYRYDAAARKWNKVNAPKLPTCINEGHLVFATDTQRLLFVGGVCAINTPNSEEAWEFDGTTWNKLTIGFANKGVGQAVTYDDFNTRVLLYGGSTLFSGSSTAYTLALDGGQWSSPEAFRRPDGRSQMVFTTDPARNNILLYGGLDETGGVTFRADSWGYRGGAWYAPPDAANGPDGCEYPLGVYDTDRQKIVVTCSGGADVWEYDGAKWTNFATVSPKPPARRFAAIAYDQKLKKTVVFGGYFNDSYRDDTWTWDGTKWAEVKADRKARPEHRGSMAMWYDPLQQRTILYGGIGRPNIYTSIARYSDMWAFNGTGWSKLDVTQTPGARLRPLVAVNPTTNKVLLFGGLRFEQLDEDSARQFYTNDTWEWDGAANKWTLIQTQTLPPVRQNGGLAWDPTTNLMTMFGGNAQGFYLSDVWTFNGVDWSPILESISGRGRAVRSQ